MTQADRARSDFDRFDLEEVGRFVVRRWTLMVSVSIVSAIFAAILCFSLTPVYTATARLLLDPRKPTVGTEPAKSGALDAGFVDSQIPIILSAPLLAKVAAKQDLAADPEFAGPQTRGLLDSIFGPARSHQAMDMEAPSMEAIDPAIAPIIRAVLGKIDLTRVAKSNVVQLSVSSRDAGKAMRLANTILETYVENQVSNHAKTVHPTAAVLERATQDTEVSTRDDDSPVISPAIEPASATSPNTKLIVPVAALAGLLLGLGAAGAMDLLPGSDLGTPAARANAFILGRVPNIAGPRAGRVDCLAYLNENPDSAFADSIGRIVETLARTRKTGRGRVVIVAPLGSGEGSTSLAVCLAAAAAAAGRRVLIIDCDQDRRGLSRRLEAVGVPGLGEVLAGDLAANKAIVARSHFELLPVGRKTFDAAGATAEALRDFLTEARGRFDLVILDASAFEAGPQPIAIGAMVDNIVLVACWHHLLREAFIAAVDSVGERPNFAGVILNRTGAADMREMALAG